MESEKKETDGGAKKRKSSTEKKRKRVTERQEAKSQKWNREGECTLVVIGNKKLTSLYFNDFMRGIETKDFGQKMN